MHKPYNQVFIAEENRSKNKTLPLPPAPQ